MRGNGNGLIGHTSLWEANSASQRRTLQQPCRALDASSCFELLTREIWGSKDPALEHVASDLQCIAVCLLQECSESMSALDSIREQTE